MKRPIPNTPDDSQKFFTFIWLAMFLALITGIEIVIIYLPAPFALLATSLVILSAIKFLAVIWWFMHLRWDKIFCTILFMLGLVIAGGTITALFSIFSFDPHEPVFEETAIELPALQSHVSSFRSLSAKPDRLPDLF